VSLIRNHLLFSLAKHSVCRVLKLRVKSGEHSGKDGHVVVVMNIRYFSYFYFLSLYLLNKEIQHDTYLNPCSEFILNFLDLFTLKSLHFANDRSYLNSNLCLSDYALFSNHDRGYADLSKRLWLCMSKRAGVFNHLFLYRFLLKYIYKYIKL
jgi:hypothetical protein